MSNVIIMGADPGLANFGVAFLELVGGANRVKALYTLTTAKSDKKLKVLSSSDGFRRCRELAEQLADLVDLHGLPSVICAEAMSYPRASSAAAKMAMSWGVVAALSAHHCIPVVQCSPQQLKKALCGRANATKEDVQRALCRRYVKADLFGKLAKSKREHAADALGAIVACRDSEAMVMARRQAAA